MTGFKLCRETFHFPEKHAFSRKRGQNRAHLWYNTEEDKHKLKKLTPDENT